MKNIARIANAVTVIAVTAVINLPASGGRKEFVYDCGVIGLCPPCTRATPLAGVGSLLVGGCSRALHIIWQIVMLIPASDGGGGGGVGIAVITICHENQHLHLRGGASEKEDSASPREDKILPRTCISFFHT